MPTLPEITDLVVAVAAIWIGGVVVIGGFDRLRAYLRRHHRVAVVRPREPGGWNPGPAQDL